MAPMPVGEAVPLGILGLFITAENVLVCFLVYRYRFLRTFTNGFVVSLALSDLLFGCVLLPMNIVDTSNPANLYLVSVILFANVTNLLAVTWDRYLAIMHPLMYTYKMNKHFGKVLAIAWLVPIPISLVPLAWGNVETRLESTVYLFAIVIGGVVLPYISILVVYILIFREVAYQVKHMTQLMPQTPDDPDRASAEKKRVSGEARVARIFAIIAGIFVVSWGPVIYMTAAAALHQPFPLVMSVISWYTMCIGALANTAMYAFFKADFRRAFLKLARCRKSTALRGCSYSKTAGASIRSTSIWKVSFNPFL